MEVSQAALEILVRSQRAGLFVLPCSSAVVDSGSARKDSCSLAASFVVEGAGRVSASSLPSKVSAISGQ